MTENPAPVWGVATCTGITGPAPETVARLAVAECCGPDFHDFPPCTLVQWIDGQWVPAK